MAFRATNKLVQAIKGAEHVQVLYKENDWAKAGDCIAVAKQVYQKYKYPQVMGYLVSQYNREDTKFPVVIAPHIWNYDTDLQTHVDFIDCTEDTGIEWEYVMSDLNNRCQKYYNKYGNDIPGLVSLGPGMIYRDHNAMPWDLFISDDKNNNTKPNSKMIMATVPHLGEELFIDTWHNMATVRKLKNKWKGKL